MEGPIPDPLAEDCENWHPAIIITEGIGKHLDSHGFSCPHESEKK